MVFVGIDVAKDKHDCFIVSSEGEVLAEVFTITNNRADFEGLLQKIHSCAGKSEKIKVGLEAMMTQYADKRREQIQFMCMDDMVPQNHLLRIIDKAIDWNFNMI